MLAFWICEVWLWLPMMGLWLSMQPLRCRVSGRLGWPRLRWPCCPRGAVTILWIGGLLLLLVLSRLWAMVCAVAWRPWARQWHDLPGISEFLAWHLGLNAVTAEANGAHFVGVAVDESKAYDAVCLPAQRRLLAAAGVPAALAAPLLSAYGFSRVVVIGDAMPGSVRPTSGMAPGCLWLGIS